jgi:hypothetical protein
MPSRDSKRNQQGNYNNNYGYIEFKINNYLKRLKKNIYLDMLMDELVVVVVPHVIM